MTNTKPMPDTLQIRAGRKSDAAAISEMIRALAGEFVVDPTACDQQQFWDSLSASAQERYLCSPRHRFLVATCGSDLVGFITVRDTSHLQHLFIALAWQGRGLARRLWEDMRGEVAATGYRGAFTVNSASRAVPVYERFGFEATDGFQDKHGIRTLPMRRRSREKPEHSS